MKRSADLEISLYHHDAESYLVEFRYSQPERDADIRLGKGEPALVQIDLEVLQSLAYDLASYSKQLTEFLFADPQVMNDIERASVYKLVGRASTACTPLGLLRLQDSSLRFC
jgi:hypothetical protein